MISCWAVLGAFASALQTYWWALAYCFGITCLEGIFWLGAFCSSSFPSSPLPTPHFPISPHSHTPHSLLPLTLPHPIPQDIPQPLPTSHRLLIIDARFQFLINDH